MTPTTPTIAIDGPAASGKGTLARGIAAHYDYAHLETGLLYRAIAQAMLEQSAAITDTATLLRTAAKLDTNHLTSPHLHDKPIGEAASKIAQNAKLRQAILDVQRNFAKNPPNGKKGVVMDGRDIGTIICPDAEVKLFVTAKLETRAHRRFLEWKKQGK
ncbi:MAG: (d)CMP kinase, partial [Parvibaculales bacterium]